MFTPEIKQDHFDGAKNITRGNKTPDNQDLASLLLKIRQDVGEFGSSSVFGGEVVIPIPDAGAATRNTDIAIPSGMKLRVLDAIVRYKGAGTAGDTVQLKHKNGVTVNDITEALDISAAANKKSGSFTDVDPTYWTLDGTAGDELRCTVTDGGGADVPATETFVRCMRVA